MYFTFVLGGIISLLAIHSFGRVVHRHEREVLLQQPASCAAITQAAYNISARERRAQGRTLSSLPPLTRSLRIASTNDPFADTQALEQPTNPFSSALDDQVHGDQTSQDPHFSSTISILRSNPRNEHATASQFASRPLSHLPQDLDVSTSTVGTPVVLVSDADMSRQQGLYQDWIISASRQSSYSTSECSFRVHETTP